MRIYSPLVYYWCNVRAGLGSEDAADVMQDVFQSVYAALGEFQHSGHGSFRGWLRVITTNKIRDHISQSKRNPTGFGGDDWQQLLQARAESTGEDSLTHENGLLVRAALDVLVEDFRDTTRKAFLLVTLDGYSAAEAASSLHLTEAAVWQACYRVRKRLREKLAGAEPSIHVSSAFKIDR